MSDLEVELTDCVATIRQLFAAAACSCALLDAHDVMTFVAADGVGTAAILGTTLPLGKGIAGFAVASGQPIAVADVASDQRFARDIAEGTAFVPTAILAAPLVSPEGAVLGVVEVLDPTARGADAGRDLDVLATLTWLMARLVRSWDRPTSSPGSAPAMPYLQVIGDESSDPGRSLRDVATAVNRLLENQA